MSAVLKLAQRSISMAETAVDSTDATSSTRPSWRAPLRREPIVVARSEESSRPGRGYESSALLRVMRVVADASGEELRSGLGGIWDSLVPAVHIHGSVVVANRGFTT